MAFGARRFAERIARQGDGADGRIADKEPGSVISMRLSVELATTVERSFRTTCGLNAQPSEPISALSPSTAATKASNSPHEGVNTPMSVAAGMDDAGRRIARAVAEHRLRVDRIGDDGGEIIAHNLLDRRAAIEQCPARVACQRADGLRREADIVEARIVIVQRIVFGEPLPAR